MFYDIYIKTDNEQDFMKYLDQINEEEIPSTEEQENNNLIKNSMENLDEDLCDNLITYDTNINSKISKEKKTVNCN